MRLAREGSFSPHFLLAPLLLLLSITAMCLPPARLTVPLRRVVLAFALLMAVHSALAQFTFADKTEKPAKVTLGEMGFTNSMFFLEERLSDERDVLIGAPPIQWQNDGIKAALKDPASDVQIQALRFCNQRQWISSLQILDAPWLQWVRDDESKSRSSAAAALGQLGASMPSAAQEELLALLGDSADDVRSSASWALGQLAESMPQKVQDALLVRLKIEGNDDVQAELIQALRRAGAKISVEVQLELIVQLKSLRVMVPFYAAEVLAQRAGKMPAEVQKALLSLLKDDAGKVGSQTKCLAAYVLGQMSEEMPDVVQQALVFGLQDSVLEEKLSAAVALSRLGRKMPLEAQKVLLFSQLEKSSYALPRRAALALRQMGVEMPAELKAMLIDLLKSSDSIGQLYAIKALGENKSPEIYKELIALLKDPKIEFKVKVEAVGALGRLGQEMPEEVQNALIALIYIPEPFVQSYYYTARKSMAAFAAEALGKMGDKMPLQTQRELLKLLVKYDPDAQKNEAELLGELGEVPPQEIQKELRYLLEKSDPASLKSASEMIENLGEKVSPETQREIINMISGSDFIEKTTVIEALGQMGDKMPPAVQQKLVELLEHSNVEMQNSAAHSLGQMGGKMPPETQQKLVRLLQNSNLSVKLIVAKLLGNLGERMPHDAQVELIKLIEDTTAYPLRLAAAEAISHLGQKMPTIPQEALVTLYRDSQNGLIGNSSPTIPLDNIGIPATSFSFLAAILSATYDKNLNSIAVSSLRFHSYLWSGRDPNALLLVKWLGNQSAAPDLDGMVPQDLLSHFSNFWAYTKEYPQLRRELARRIGQVVERNGAVLPLGPETREKLKTLKDQLQQEKDPDCDSAMNRVEDAIKSNERSEQTRKWSLYVLGGIALHMVFWLLLLLLYPTSPKVRAFCFWNPWFREFVGFGYVGLVLRWVPAVRRRLFIPFTDSLVEDGNLASLEKEPWFPHSLVQERDAPAMPLDQSVPELRGRIVITGVSGLGKTTLLRRLAQRARMRGRIVVFLNAEKCHGGVLEAIQQYLPQKNSGTKEGRNKEAEKDRKPAAEASLLNGDFLCDLVLAGALDLCIDGLNQVPPETRARISAFMTQFAHANIIVTTQPIVMTAGADITSKNTIFGGARELKLLPLTPEKILEFLKTVEPTLPPGSSLRGKDYIKKCTKWHTRVLAGPRAEEAVDVLSNPLNATVAAQCLASGTDPDLHDLLEQRYLAMADKYKSKLNLSFPLVQVAEIAYGMLYARSKEQENEKFQPDAETQAASEYMIDSGMLIPTSLRATTGKWCTFRHDKIREYFVVHAFNGRNHGRRTEHLSDEVFRGVYWRLAYVLPLDEAFELREQLILNAAATGDHSISEGYINIFKQRKDIPASPAFLTPAQTVPPPQRKKRLG